MFLRKIFLLSLTITLSFSATIKDLQDFRQDNLKKQEALKFEYIKTKELLELNKKKKELLKLSEQLFSYEDCIKNSVDLKSFVKCSDIALKEEDSKK